MTDDSWLLNLGLGDLIFCGYKVCFRARSTVYLLTRISEGSAGADLRGVDPPFRPEQK